MAVRLLLGGFGSPDPYAANDFEDMEVSANGFIQTLYGGTQTGTVTLGPGFFGPGS